MLMNRDLVRIPPKVSVFMMAYNHAPYIEQALKGVLAQKTDFSFEIIIGEDCSLDGTRAIVIDYAQRYPSQIRALLHEENIGAGRNQTLILEACDGQYIAICEGDDFWIDNYKLQKQIDFLDANIGYAICFHRVYEQNGDKRVLSYDNPWEIEKTFNIEDLALKNFMHTNSVVYRNGLIDAFPNWFEKSPIGDFVLHLLNARNGLIKYLPEPMGVYRKFTGTWSSQNVVTQIQKVILVIDLLLGEKFSQSVICNLKIHKENLINNLFEVIFETNDYSYISVIDEYLKCESSFVRHWMLIGYPNRIKQLTSSRTFRFAKLLSRVLHIFNRK
jgi:glycosyltransferase involved in cell wall biosynthesis